MKLTYLLFVLTLAVSAHAGAAKLSLSQYLSQVQGGNAGLRSSYEASQGAIERYEEAYSLIAPTFFANGQWMDDAKTSPFFNYQKLVTNQYQLGVSQTMTTGTQAKFTYSLGYTSYQGFKAPYYEGRPMIEVTQPLWRNFFGNETRAEQAAHEAGALATHYAEAYKAKATIAQAEITYWRLILARENIVIQKDSLARAEKIAAWTQRRARLKLSDDSDWLQAQAALETRRFQLELAQNEERAASRAFNLTRGVVGDTVNDELQPLEAAWIEKIEVPKRVPVRDDVKAAEQASLASTAQARIALSRNLPILEVYGAYALNSRKPESSDAFSNSWTRQQPTTLAGVRFVLPLDIATVIKVRGGYRRDELAADLSYERKMFEQEQDWDEWVQKFTESKTRLKLAYKIEKAQELKLAHERERLSKGRSTTYQVIVFEQDLAQAQLMRLEAEAQALQGLAQLKLFSQEVKYE